MYETDDDGRMVTTSGWWRALVALGAAVLAATAVAAIVGALPPVAVVFFLLTSAFWMAAGYGFTYRRIEVDPSGDSIVFVAGWLRTEQRLSDLVKLRDHNMLNRYFTFRSGRRVWTPTGFHDWFRVDPVLREHIARNPQSQPG